MPPMPLTAPRLFTRWPALALLINALVWGCSWWPFRQLQAVGLHPLWATVLIYTASVGVIIAARPRALGQLLRTPELWWLLVAAGTTNAAFNWAVVIGDVVRVILLFYLMPLWTVLLARLLLHEPLTRAAALRVLVSLAGAAIVLWPDGEGGLPLPRSLPDWLGVLGGFSFALNNVLLRRAAHRPEEGRAVAMFGGGVVVAGVLATALAAGGTLPWPPAPAPGWVLGALALALLFLVGNLALQFAAARLPANVTSVVMLTEVVFASASAVALGGGVLTPRLLVGGGLIVLSALLAVFEPGATAEASTQH
jgi:drug/metabolite transporter (DMT)-like permease